MTVRHALRMPKLGLTMTEGLVADWLIQVGQSFGSGDAIFVVETDKVANEISAEGTGTLMEMTVPTGTTVPVGTVIGYWEDGQPDAARDAAIDAQTTASQMPASRPAPDAVYTPSLAAVPTAPQMSAEHHIAATPHARRLARQRGIALETLQGSGPRGRIVARDVESAPVSVPAQTVETPPQDDDAYTRISPTALQATVARRLTRGKQETPHFYLTLDADVSRLVALRQELKAAQPEYRLTTNHFIVMAVARALARTPQANRVWRDDGILAFRRIDVGIAVDTEAGLLAPAVTDVGDISLTELGHRLDAVVERARADRLIPADVGHPAVTVSNAGMHNVTYMSSIINPGQAMVLGVGSIKGVFRPDAHGAPVLRQEMGLVLSADHRVIDGVGALRFLNTIVDFLQHPVRLLMHGDARISIGEKT